MFLLGANYEGPADRAWQMWDDGRFDPSLIARDMDRARGAGISVLRVFLQRSLAQDIRATRWSKLDTLLRLADQRGLKLVLTFADYPEVSVANLVAMDAAVAGRYWGRSTILAYDLKNEPRFGDLALAEYPVGVYVALQDRSLVPVVGETIPREEIPAYRASEEGRARIPARLSDDRAHVYANMVAAYLRFLADAQAWAGANDSTSVAYLRAPDSTEWDGLEEALNDTLATWLTRRLDALRAADPGATVTVGYNDPILASLPANNRLDYRTIHRYPSASEAGIQNAMALFRDVRAAIPGKPLVLGEFGFSNASVAEDRSAELEGEMVRAVRDGGGAGALKWMLNDFPEGFSARENAFGMFRGDGSAKPIVASFGEMAALTPLTQPAHPRPADYDIVDGHFFTQSSGRPRERDPSGYSVTNADGIPFWDTWQRLGLDSVGHPLSRRFLWRGFPTQVFQRLVFQWQPDVGVSPINVFDELHARGLDAWLQARKLVPRQVDLSTETALSWEEGARRRLALLDASAALRNRYFASPDPLLVYGLPTSPARDMGEAVALRTQRAVLFEWKINTPWARAGDVTVANGGEIAKELNLFPIHALVPEPAPELPVPSHGETAMGTRWVRLVAPRLRVP